MSKHSIQCRLALLYLLQKSEIPLSEPQLARIMSDTSLMNFFDLKSALHELCDGGQTDPVPTLDGDVYTLTERGDEMITSLRTDLLHSTRASLDAYLEANGEALVREATYPASYTRSGERAYRAQGRVMSDGLPIFEVTMLVGSREEANTFVRSWQEKGPDIYQRVLLELTV